MNNPKVALPDKVVGDVYQDVGQPAAKEVGKTLAGVVRVVLSPFNAIIWGFDKISTWIENEVSEKLANVPVDKIKTPDPLIAGPLIENMRFSERHEEMRKMYASLLAHSMVEGEDKKILPSFVDIVRQLSPLDVLILEYLEQQQGGATRIVDIRAENMNNSSFGVPSSFVTLFANYIPYAFPGYTENDVAVAVNDLQRLDLIQIPDGVYIITSYDDIKQTPFYLSYLTNSYALEQGWVLNILKKKMAITTFGRQFLSCVK